jgi:PAS domain S-box-containing protein
VAEVLESEASIAASTAVEPAGSSTLRRRLGHALRWLLAKVARAPSRNELTYPSRAGLSEGMDDDRWNASPGPEWWAVFQRLTVPVLIYQLDEAGRPLPFLAINDAALRLYGFSRDEMLSMTSMELVDPDVLDIPRAIEDIRRRSSLVVDSQHVARDGRRIPVEVHAHYFEIDGCPTILSICRDVSERKQAEAAALEQERRLARVLESINDAFLALDHDLRITYVNRLAASVVGKQPADLVGRLLLEEYPVYQGTEIERAARRALETGEPVRLETLSPVSGRYLEVTFYATPEGLSIFSRDISDRMQAQAELERHTERLRQLAAASLAVTAAPDLEAKLQVITDEARRIIGAHQSVTSLTRGPDWAQSINAVSLSEKYAEYHDYDAMPDGSGIYAEVCRHNQVFRLTQEELEAHPAYKHFGRHAADHPPLQGWLAAPLVGSSGENMGVIQLSDKEEGNFEEDDEAVLVQFAQFASIAIEAATAERARLEAAEQFRVLAEAMPQKVFTAGPSGSVENINRQWLEFSGLLAEELQGDGWTRLVHPDDLKMNVRAWQRAVEQGEPFEFEHRFRRADGEYRWHLSRALPLRDPKGQVVMWVGSNTDVHDLKVAEQSVRESEERFRALVSQTTAGIAQVDLTGHFLYVNDRYCEITGYDANTLYGMKMQDITHPDDLPGNIPLFKRAIQTGEPFTVEKRYLCPDRREVWVNNSVTAIVNEQGTPYGVVAVTIDISERRQQEQALRESEERYRGLVETTAAIVWTARPDGYVDYFSPQWYEYTGLSTEQTLGEGWTAAIPPEHRERVLDAWHEAASQGREYEVELPLNGADGVSRWHLARGLAIRGGDGHVSRWIGTALDIHERKQAQEELVALNATLERRVVERTAVAEHQAQQLRQLAAQLTRVEQNERRRLALTLHDHLQQLLVAAKFHIGVVEGRLESEAGAVLDQVNDLIDQSIDVSRSLTVELSPPVLHEAGLGAGLEWLARWMKDKHDLTVDVQIEAGAEPEDEHVRTMLFEAARELLFNVVKHARVNRASAELSRLGREQVRMVITDEGIGFDPARAYDAPEPIAGLGLRSIRERLTHLDGQVVIDTERGQGTRIMIVAPRLAIPMDRPYKMAPGEPPSGGRPGTSNVSQTQPAAWPTVRVLLADDHKILREGLASLLGGIRGIEIIGEAEDGLQAVELALELKPDVVVMDVTMPRLNGVEATRRIMKALPGVRVIGLSMHSEADMAYPMREAGASAYLTKGGPAGALVDAIRGM